MNLAGKTAAIQGYGNAGSYAHQLAVEILGMEIVAVSDSKGGIYCAAGLDYRQVQEHKLRTGSVINFPDTEPISNEDLLALDVAVLFPSALENVITERNAARINAQIIAELANGPTTPEADEILFEHNVFVLPDILCNAGGVTVSYFEQVQNASIFYWDAPTIHRLLDDRITTAFGSMHALAAEHRVHNRLAAHLLAVRRIYEAMKARGWA